MASHPVRIITVDPRFTLSGETQKVINWNNPSDRKWLQNHMHWALNNGMKVGLEPLVEAA